MIVQPLISHPQGNQQTTGRAGPQVGPLTASKPTLNRPSASITCSPRPGPPPDPPGGLGPAAVTGVFRFRDSQPKSNGTGKSSPSTATRCASAGNGDQDRRRRRRRERRSLLHLRGLLLVEDHDPLLAQRVPGRQRAAVEGALVDLRVAPDDEVGAAGERAAVDVAGGEVGRQRLAVVGRRPGSRSGRRRCTRRRPRSPGWWPTASMWTSVSPWAKFSPGLT